VKNIIEAHDGMIRIDNQREKGARVSIKFPLRQEPTIMETILIVDDEKNYTLILAAILEDEGFETLTANSGSGGAGDSYPNPTWIWF
jgi:PleD family two-component response regulator